MVDALAVLVRETMAAAQSPLADREERLSNMRRRVKTHLTGSSSREIAIADGFGRCWMAYEGDLSQDLLELAQATWKAACLEADETDG